MGQGWPKLVMFHHNFNDLEKKLTNPRVRYHVYHILHSTEARIPDSNPLLPTTPALFLYLQLDLR